MKRKNLDYIKTRRFIKKSKFSEALNSSSYLYIKLFFLWFLVVFTDFLIEFRFEYLWPFYLLIKNIYASFKYQGLVFSVFFVFFTLTSDIICFFFIPVQWLFFTASTYIWLQYVWNSEKGICFQTFTVWLIFVYIEATVRLKELKSISINLNICRTFAAQCVGYPFVVLGFGFKKYINYKIMLRRRKDMIIEDELFISIQNTLSTFENYSFLSRNELIANILSLQDKTLQKEDDNKISYYLNQVLLNCQNIGYLNKKNDSQNSYKKLNKFGLDSFKSSEVSLDNTELTLFQRFKFYFSLIFPNSFNNFKFGIKKSTKEKLDSSVINLDIDNKSNKKNEKNNTKSKVLNSFKFLTKSFIHNIIEIVKNNIINILKNNHSKENKNKIIQGKDYLIHRLENDIKKLKTDLQISRQMESNFKEKLNKIQSNKNEMKYQCNKLEHHNYSLQSKLKNLNNIRQQDKNTIDILEKKLQDERKFKNILEKQLLTEKKLRPLKDSQNLQTMKKSSPSDLQNSNNILNKNNNSCIIDNCKKKKQDLEKKIDQLKIDVQNKDIEINFLKNENQSFKKFRDSYKNEEVLINALTSMQERNKQLENSLSAETKLKLDLFSVLGETRRQLEINQVLFFEKSKETEDLRSRLFELMAIMPEGINDPYSLIYSDDYLTETCKKLHKQNKNEKIFDWNLSDNQNFESTSDNVITSKSSSPDLL